MRVDSNPVNLHIAETRRERAMVKGRLCREEMIEQLHLVAEEVFPRLGEPIERRPITGSPLV